MSLCDKEKYFEMINLHIDGELSEEQKQELSVHLSECEECAKLYKVLSENKQACGELNVQAPYELKRNVMDKLYPPKKGFIKGAITVATTAAALLFVVFGTAPFWLAMMPAGSAAPEADMVTDNNYGDSDKEMSETVLGDERILSADAVYSVAETDEGMTVTGFQKKGSVELRIEAKDDSLREYLSELLQKDVTDELEVSAQELELLINDKALYEKAELIISFAENGENTCVIKIKG